MPLNTQALDPSIVAAAISAGAIVISTGISVTLTRIVTRREIKKLALERETLLLDRLYQKRLDSYPQLYEPISAFLKKLRFETIKKQDVVEFRKAFESVDSSLSVLFSPSTSKALHKINQFLHDLEDIESNKSSLIKACSNAETLLKHDIGVYSIAEFVALETYSAKVEKAHNGDIENE